MDETPIPLHKVKAVTHLLEMHRMARDIGRQGMANTIREDLVNEITAHLTRPTNQILPFSACLTQTDIAEAIEEASGAIYWLLDLLEKRTRQNMRKVEALLTY